MATDSGLFHRLYLIASTYQHEGCDFAEQLRYGQNGEPIAQRVEEK